MAFQELYVDASGNAANGGSSAGAPKVDDTALNNVDAVQISGVTHTLENKDNDGWGTTAVGDWLCFDTAAAKKLCVVTATAVGGDTDIIQVKSLTGAESIAATGKGVRVGGAWNSPSVAATFLNGIGATNYAATGIVAQPWLNILTANTAGSENIDYQETAMVQFSATWSGAAPLCVAAYATTPRDLDWWTTTTRACLSFGTNNAYVYASGTNIHLYNLYSTGSVNAVMACIYNGGVNSTFTNCKGVHTGASAVGAAVRTNSATGRLIRCIGVRTNTGSTASSVIVGVGTSIDCIAIGPGKAASRGIGFSITTGEVIRGIAYKCTDGAQCDTNGSATLVGCTLANCVNGIYFNGNGAATATIQSCKIGHNTYGISATGSGGPYVMMHEDYNEFYANATANIDPTYLVSIAQHDQTAGSAMFVDQANDDYRPASNSAGNDTGFPGILAPGGAAWTGYTDIGALGRQHSTGGIPLGVVRKLMKRT